MIIIEWTFALIALCVAVLQLFDVGDEVNQMGRRAYERFEKLAMMTMGNKSSPFPPCAMQSDKALLIVCCREWVSLDRTTEWTSLNIIQRITRKLKLLAMQFSAFTNDLQPTTLTMLREWWSPVCMQKGGRVVCFIGKHLLYIAKEVVNKFITHSLNKQSMSIMWEAINKAIVSNNNNTNNQ